MTMYSIIYLITEVFLVYILSLFFGSFLGERRTSRVALVLTYILYLVIADGEYLLINNAVLNLVLNLLFMFLITLHYDVSYKRRIIVTFLLYVLMATIEMFVVAITTTIDISAIQQNIYQEIQGPIMVKLIAFIIILLLRNLKNVKEDVIVPVPYWISIFVIPLSSVYLIYIVIVNGVEYFNKVQVAISVAVIFLIDIVTFYLYDAVTRYYNERIKNELLQRENLFYSWQFENIQEHIEEVNSFRHDFKNHLEVLDSLLESKPDEARSYITGITGVLNAKNQYSKSGNIPIDSIINYKLSKAQEKEVEVETKISIPKELNFEPSDMVVILGNLLDNAINASMKIEEGRNIKFNMTYKKGMLQIEIVNAFDGYVRFEKNRIQTTSGDERYHGYGLKNVESVLKKYHGFCEISYDDHIFCVKAFMYV